MKVLKARRDYVTLHFYRQFIDHSFLAGGSLPADLESLSAAVEMPKDKVECALRYCLGRLLHKVGARLFQKRVRRDVIKELRYRHVQSLKGSLGGRPRVAKGYPKGDLSPPAPTPTPTPHNETPPLPPAPAGGTQGGEFDLPPGMETNGHGQGREARKARLEEARQYAIHVGYHPNRNDIREMRSWVTAGRTLPEIQRALDIAREQNEPISPGKRPRL